MWTYDSSDSSIICLFRHYAPTLPMVPSDFSTLPILRLFRCVTARKRINREVTFTANGKMKFPFCQNTEKLDLFQLFSCLLTRYIE